MMAVTTENATMKRTTPRCNVSIWPLPSECPFIWSVFSSLFSRGRISLCLLFLSLVNEYDYALLEFLISSRIYKVLYNLARFLY